MDNGYKSSKEAFVSGMTGSNVTHINLISAVALFSIALHSALTTRLSLPKSTQFIISWLVLIVPLLLSMTVFADRPWFLSSVLLIPTLILQFIPLKEFGTPLPSSQPSIKSTGRVEPVDEPSSRSPLPKTSLIPPLPALTIYRAHMLLMTILAILAVDFPVFPRSLAKCESYGVSLMDLGVGSFVFSQGVVSAIPLLKDAAYLTGPIVPKFIYTIQKSLPIIVLGAVRVVLVKGTEYPEHESEYGTHWNFFITLALLPVIQVLLHPVIRHNSIALVATGIALCQQFTLSGLGMETYVLAAPRTNIISANKEGIVSLLGYLAIHLFGLSTGTLVLAPSPSYFRRRQQEANARVVYDRREHKPHLADTRTRPTVAQARQNDKTAIELISFAAVWWTLMGLMRILGIDAGVSRRMVNLSYILWVIAFNTSFILGYLLLDLYFFPSPGSRSMYSPTSHLKLPVDPSAPVPKPSGSELGNPPALLDAINKNGLVLFLVANVATGLINFGIQTMYTSDFWAMLIMSGYTLGLCGLAWVLRHTRIWRI